MRFRATLERDALLLLLNTATSMAKVNDEAVLYLTEEELRISLTNNSIDSVRCFCEIQTDQIFNDYRINSLSNNSLLLQLNLDNFSKALNSGKNAAICLLKLVKHNNLPFICFEAKASGGLTVDVTHNIPVTVMKAADIIYYLPSVDTPPPIVALKLSRCKVIKNIIDRMKYFSKSIEVIASQIGRINFRVNSECVINTFVNGLQPFYEGTLGEETDKDNTINIMVDNKKLALLFSIPQVQLLHSILC